MMASLLFGQVLDGDLGAHQEAAASGAVGLVNPLRPWMKPAVGKSGPCTMVRISSSCVLRLFHQQNGRGKDLGEIMRRNVGGHAHGNAVGAVDEQGRNARGQHGGLDGRVVEVGDEVHRVLVDVGQQLGGNRRQPGFGVTVGGRRIAIHRAEVSLSVHQAVAQREILRHAHHGVIDRGVAVGVILAEHFADHFGALDVLAVVQQPHVMHGVENAPVHRLQSVAHVGQRAANDDRHGIVEIGAPHLLFNVDGLHVGGWSAAFQRKQWIVRFVGHGVLNTFRHAEESVVSLRCSGSRKDECSTFDARFRAG